MGLRALAPVGWAGINLATLSVACLFLGACFETQQASVQGSTLPTEKSFIDQKVPKRPLRFALIKADSDQVAFEALQNLLFGLGELGYFAFDHYSLPMSNYKTLSQTLFEAAGTSIERGPQLVFSQLYYLDLSSEPLALSSFLKRCTNQRQELDALLVLGDADLLKTTTPRALPPIFEVTESANKQNYNDVLFRSSQNIVDHLKQSLALPTIAIVSSDRDHSDLGPELLIKNSAAFESDAYLLIDTDKWLPSAKLLSQVLLSAKKPVFAFNQTELLYFGAAASIRIGSKHELKVLHAGDLLEKIGIENDRFQAAFSGDVDWRFSINLNNLRLCDVKTPITFILAAESVIGLRETLPRPSSKRTVAQP